MGLRKFHRSCLRWPGNKFCLIEQLQPYFPEKFNNYHEPFLGSGTVLFNTKFEKKAFASDINPLLINFFDQVKNSFDDFEMLVRKKVNEEDFYYRERDVVYIDKVEQAAQFYYLNRTCFNGIFRVNSEGKFNVPFGKRKSTDIFDLTNLTRIKNRLVDIDITCADFDLSLDQVNEGDFIFLDPPYSPKASSNKFLMYNEVLFSWEDQKRLQLFCQGIIDRGATFVMTNLHNGDVHSLFAEELGLEVGVLSRYSRVGSKMADRGIIKEYIFTNNKKISTIANSEKASSMSLFP